MRDSWYTRAVVASSRITLHHFLRSGVVKRKPKCEVGYVQFALKATPSLQHSPLDRCWLQIFGSRRYEFGSFGSWPPGMANFFRVSSFAQELWEKFERENCEKKSEELPHLGDQQRLVQLLRLPRCEMYGPKLRENV